MERKFNTRRWRNVKIFIFSTVTSNCACDFYVSLIWRQIIIFVTSDHFSTQKTLRSTKYSRKVSVPYTDFQIPEHFRSFLLVLRLIHIQKQLSRRFRRFLKLFRNQSSSISAKEFSKWHLIKIIYPSFLYTGKTWMSILFKINDFFLVELLARSFRHIFFIEVLHSPSLFEIFWWIAQKKLSDFSL